MSSIFRRNCSRRISHTSFDSLSPAAWQNVATLPAPAGATATFTGTTAGTQSFHRVVLSYWNSLGGIAAPAEAGVSQHARSILRVARPSQLLTSAQLRAPGREPQAGQVAQAAFAG